MKKIIFLTLMFLLIPYIISNVFEREKEYYFDFMENTFVRVKRDKYNRIDIVPLEEYVVGVVAGEMPVSFDIEALKAQALAARTYVLKKMEQNIDNDYDVIDTIANQVYLDNEMLKNSWKDNYIENINKIRKAVSSTRGEYITYNGEVITAFFFSTSVGKTENSEDVFISALPYLRSVDSSWEEGVSPVFKEENRFTKTDFCERLSITCEGKINYDILKTTSTGRIKEIKINNKTFTGSQVVNYLDIRSSYFSIEEVNDTIYVTTKGYGHGVGMSQYGALAMAKKGYTYDEIIKYYYQGVEILKK